MKKVMMTSIATAMIASALAAHAGQASQPIPRGIVAVRADGDVNALIDGVSIEPVTDLAPNSMPLPESLMLSVASGAFVQLDFADTQRVDRVNLGGRFVSGVISQETCPDFVAGPGALYAIPKGSLMFLR